MYCCAISLSLRRSALTVLSLVVALLAPSFASSALAAPPPRIGVMLDVDKSASTVDCATEVLAKVTTILEESGRVQLVSTSAPAATWQEMAATNELSLAAVVSIDKSTVKFGGQTMGMGDTNNNVFTAETSLRVRIMDVASSTAVLEQEFKGQSSIGEPVKVEREEFSTDATTGVGLVDAIIVGAEATELAVDVVEGSIEWAEMEKRRAKETDQYAEKYQKTLMDSIHRATKKLKKPFLKALPIRGQITSVEAKSASLDVGEDWGITKKIKFIAYRPAADGTQSDLGVLSVKSVSGNTTVLKGSKKVLSALQAGDQVRSK